MEALASRLAGMTQRWVNDETGLKGKYDVAMRWVMGSGPPEVGADDSSDAGGPGLFEALQSQLGLKLESKKGLAELLVVDHCERMPAEN